MHSASDEQTLEDARPRLTDPAGVAQARAALPGVHHAADVADIFGLLADPGRLRLLGALACAELCVGDLAAVAGLSESAASHALRILRAHRVVRARRVGRLAFYSLADEHVRSLLELALAHVAHVSIVHDHALGDDG